MQQQRTEAAEATRKVMEAVVPAQQAMKQRGRPVGAAEQAEGAAEACSTEDKEAEGGLGSDSRQSG